MGDFAAFTITRNEPLFLRTWLNYYTSNFPPEDVYVIDNSTDDGSVEEARLLHPRVNFVCVPSRGTHVSLFLKQVVEQMQRELLQRYPVVVFAETDEFLIPNAKYVNLRDYCERFLKSKDQWRRAVGWNVVQQPGEAMLSRTPGAQLLVDRRSMWRLPMYDKTLVTKVPMTYQRGFHNFYLNGIKQVNEPIDPTLSLLHGWCLDVDEYFRRHSARLNIADRQSVIDVFANIDKQSNQFGDPYAVGEVQLMPEHWRQLLTY